jgi:hypothetical protein
MLAHAQENVLMLIAKGNAKDEVKNKVAKYYATEFSEKNHVNIIFEPVDLENKSQINKIAIKKEIPYFAFAHISSKKETLSITLTLYETESEKMIKSHRVKTQSGKELKPNLNSLGQKVFSINKSGSIGLSNSGLGFWIGGNYRHFRNRSEGHGLLGLGLNYVRDREKIIYDFNLGIQRSKYFQYINGGANFLFPVKHNKKSFLYGVGIFAAQTGYKANDYYSYEVKWRTEYGLGLKGHIGYTLVRTNRHTMLFLASPYYESNALADGGMFSYGVSFRLSLNF